MSNLLQQLNNDISTTIKIAGRSLVKVGHTHNGTGAGIIIHADGLILTNAHVIRHGPTDVTLPDERKVEAKVLAYDSERDLAALSVDMHDLPAIEWGNSKTLQPGQLVFAPGHPWGVSGGVSVGPVINMGSPPEISHLNKEFVQAGLQLRPGHSGGPMVDTQGRLVGINTMITGPEVGLAIPVHIVKDFLDHHLGSGSNPIKENSYI